MRDSIKIKRCINTLISITRENNKNIRKESETFKNTEAQEQFGTIRVKLTNQVNHTKIIIELIKKSPNDSLLLVKDDLTKKTLINKYKNITNNVLTIESFVETDFFDMLNNIKNVYVDNSSKLHHDEIDDVLFECSQMKNCLCILVC